MQKNIKQLENAVLQCASDLCLNVWNTSDQRSTCYHTMNLCTAVPAAKYNLVGGLFDMCDEEPAVQCVACKDVMYVSLDLACMEYNLYSHISLEQFICPVYDSEWPASDVFMRAGLKGRAQCPVCGSEGKFKWVHVPFDPNKGKYPLTLFIQRRRPEVEPIAQPTGPVPIKDRLRIGERFYHYCGWTAKMGELSMVPHLTVSDQKAVRYCFTNGGLVQFVSESANYKPKDTRHLDMLVYRLKNY